MWRSVEMSLKRVKINTGNVFGNVKECLNRVKIWRSVEMSLKRVKYWEYPQKMWRCAKMSLKRVKILGKSPKWGKRVLR